MSSKNFMSYEDATTVLGAYAEAIKNKQDALTAGDYINLNNGNISVNRNLVVDNYLYTIGTNDAYYITVTKSQGGEIISTNTYSYSRGTVTNVDGNFTITHDYDNRLGYVWVYTSLKDSAEHTVGYTWTKAVTDTPFSVDEAFPSEDVSGYKLVIKSEMDTALAGKQNTLTFDDTPTDNSNNPVKSNGIYDALALKQDATDNSLDTEAKTIVGAINEHEGDVGSLKSGFTNLSEEVNGDATTYDFADVITIEDAVPANLAECNVKIEPVQDLHGYDHPWVGGAGKNKFNIDGLIANTRLNGSTGETEPAEGISCTDFISVKSNQAYIISGFTAVRFVLYDSNKDYIDSFVVSDNVSFSTTATTAYVRFHDTTTDITNVAQFEEGQTATTFAPYTNICPITGHTEASVQRDGVNMLNLSQMELFNQNRYAHFKEGEYLSVKPNTTYTLSYKYGGGDGKVYGYDLSGNRTTLAGSIPNNPKYVTFTTASDTVKIVFYSLVSSDGSISLTDAEIQVELGSSATDYEPYQGKTYTIALGDTIYGGTVDFDSGVMTASYVSKTYNGDSSENWSKNDVGSSSEYAMRINLPDNYNYIDRYAVPHLITNYLTPISQDETWGNFDTFISNMETVLVTGIRTITTVADWKTYLASNPLQVCYKLATPTTIQLTPQQIQLLKGQNTLTASTGQISVTVNGVSGSIGQVQEQVNELSANVGGAKLKTLKYTGTGTTSYTLDFGDDTPATIMQIIPEPGETVITNNYEYLSGFAWGVPFTYCAWANKSNNLPSSHGGFNISQITYSDNTCTIIGPSASAAANYEGQKYAVYYLA